MSPLLKRQLCDHFSLEFPVGSIRMLHFPPTVKRQQVMKPRDSKLPTGMSVSDYVHPGRAPLVFYALHTGIGSSPPDKNEASRENERMHACMPVCQIAPTEQGHCHSDEGVWGSSLCVSI